jgi:hypothetical protein
MNTNILNFPTLIPPNILEITHPLPFASDDMISPKVGEHYFKVVIGQDGETLFIANISKEVKALKEKFENTEALTDFVKTVF